MLRMMSSRLALRPLAGCIALHLRSSRRSHMPYPFFVHGKSSFGLRLFASFSSSAPSSTAPPIPLTAGVEQPVDRRKYDRVQGIRHFSDADKVATLLTIPQERIRNFSIIAHIDHGKSTLADRLLSTCGNITSDQRGSGQVLDKLEVEKERGITVKAQTASLFFQDDTLKDSYLLNLIDCPGHVDFAYEVSRSLAACQGALLLVDCSQGIQAQTLANYYIAMENNLAIIPVLSKVDLPYADVAGVTEQMVNAFGVDEKEIIQCSAKSGLGISDVLSAIIERIPPPKGKIIGEANTSSRAFLFDTWYDIHRGVICLLKVEDGEISKGDVICAYHSGGVFDVSEVGLLTPEKHPGLTDILRAGQVGYIVAGIKSTKDVRLGETFFIAKKGGWKLPENKKRANLEEERGKIHPLPGFKPAKSMVFAGLFPGGENDFEELSLAMNKLTLNDASVSFTKETSMALGMGFRCGFLGVLHMDVFTQRLQQEFGCSVITTAPTVPYEATMIETDEITDQQLQLLIDSPKAFPDPVAVDTFYEPMVRVSLITPQQYVGDLTQLCVNYRGELEDVKFVSADRAIMRYKIPLAEVIIDFYQQVKSVSSGFASLDYEELPVQEAEIVKLDIKINGEAVDALSTICHSSKAVTLGKRLALKLKESIDRQNFEIIIQAFQGGKIVARERVAPFRKDVLVKSGKMVGGGDITRKKKLLEKQKEGKKRMKSVGSVDLNDDTFLSVMKAHSSTD